MSQSSSRYGSVSWDFKGRMPTCVEQTKPRTSRLHQMKPQAPMTAAASVTSFAQPPAAIDSAHVLPTNQQLSHEIPKFQMSKNRISNIVVSSVFYQLEIVKEITVVKRFRRVYRLHHHAELVYASCLWHRDKARRQTCGRTIFSRDRERSRHPEVPAIVLPPRVPLSIPLF